MVFFLNLNTVNCARLRKNKTVVSEICNLKKMDRSAEIGKINRNGIM